MAHSPGPSTSRIFKNSLYNHSKAETSEESSKKKRIRRGGRAKRKPSTENHQNNHKVNSDSYTFTIQSVKQTGLAYRKRDPSTGHINLNSYVKSTPIPHVFHTPPVNPLLLQKLQNLQINGAIRLQTSSTSIDKNKQRKSAPKKNKKCHVFPEYITEEQVQEGLANGHLIKGFLRVNAKNTRLAYVGNADSTQLDYIICSVLERNRALDGDEVVIRPKDSKEHPGEKNAVEVVYILKEIHPRIAVGRLELIPKGKEISKEYAMFIPRDKRIPKMKIAKISWPYNFLAEYDKYKEMLFQAKITKWDEVRQAMGSITAKIGRAGELGAESLAILREFCLDPTPYDHRIRKFLPKSTAIPRAEFTYREDLRSMCIFTIDPATARDLDDAVSCSRLANGNYEVGVHISDASFYLPEDTLLDEMVRDKATTIYMVDNVYHMLPLELCLQCSLLPGADKLAFSVFWEMTAHGEVLSKRVTRSVINSCCQLSYEHAQAMINDPAVTFDRSVLPPIHNGFAVEDLARTVNDLQAIAVHLREQRSRNGALKIDQIKIGFGLDPVSGEPVQFYKHRTMEANRLIEEFMLLANMTVAECINSAYPDLAFLRSHEPPKPTMMIDLKRNMEKVGVFIDIDSSKSIQVSLDKYQTEDSDIAGVARMAVLNHLLAKPMKRARYFCAGALADDLSFHHFALSIPIYTHFTSPIRRYADIVVHRLLAASLKYRPKPTLSAEEMAAIADVCNRQKYHAKRAGEASSDLYLAHYVQKHEPFVQDGVVVDVRENFMEVIVLGTGSMVRMYKEKLGNKLECQVEELPDESEEAETQKRKNYRFVVTFPPNPPHTNHPTKTVLETFSLVKVRLTRKANCSQLEGQLCR